MSGDGSHLPTDVTKKPQYPPEFRSGAPIDESAISVTKYTNILHNKSQGRNWDEDSPPRDDRPQGEPSQSQPSDQGTAPPSSTKYLRWTTDEDRQLLDYFSQGLGWTEIDAKFPMKTYGSTSSRWHNYHKSREEGVRAAQTRKESQEVKKRQKN